MSTGREQLTRDVENRFERSGTLREAGRYVGALLILAGVVFAMYTFAARGSVVAASLVPAILFVGGVGAFVKTYKVWKAEGAWVVWQGAGWFLLTSMLVTLAIPGAAIDPG
jgi:NADH:ubiquinone oxidoreductase subunit H